MNVATSERLNEDRSCRFRCIKGAGFRLAIEVTRRCNLSCKHCFVQPARVQPHTDYIIDVIRQAGQLNCRKLIITGGEPLLRQDLEQIIASATAQGLLVDLNSNFFNLTRDRANALKVAGLQETSVSLYGERSVHDELTGQPGAFDRVLRGIGYFRDIGITVDVHGAIWNDMLPCVGRLIDSVQERGVSSITFFSLIPTENRSTHGERILFPAMALKTIEQARAFSSIPVRTVGLSQFEEGECVMGNGIYGLGTDMRLRPCLLSQHKYKDIGVDLYTHSLPLAISILETQIKHGEWFAACYTPGKRSLDA